MGKTNGFMKKTLFALLAVFTAVSFLPKNSQIRPEEFYFDGRGAFYAKH